MQEIRDYEQKVKNILASKKFLDKDQKALLERLNGRQPTLDIFGQTYYVNWRTETLERKGDSISPGINFAELEEYYNEDFTLCELPYNKKTHQVVEFDHDIIEMPKDVAIVAFPPPQKMDPVGYSRTGAEHLSDLLEESPQGRDFVAQVLKGKDSWLEYNINSNRKDKGLPPLKTKARTMRKGI